ncbi:hypothetical protein CVT25_002361 [Psilocybe cyanescens]|uniref:F-box domain-containing protein n=1 Tax=Psilocybe cyanescens TaxID=93625 RepID=A0A409WKN2_PSICY|nr:hypothetical protein CVT25_002361 [Psilocybe cyanescens]
MVHVATTTDDWDLESIPSSELASLASPSMLAEDDHDLEFPGVPPPPDYESAATLAAIHERIPRLVLDSFIPILTKIQTSLRIEENEYHIVKDIDKAKWEQLQEYARCVEELTLSDAALPKVAASVFFRLGQLQGAKNPLFPVLSKLHITNTTSSPIPYLELFFSTSLRSISIEGIASSSKMTVASFLKKVGAQTKMDHLVLHSISLLPEISDAIGYCLHLTSLELTNLTGLLDYSPLEAVAYLSRLKSFRIDAKDATRASPSWMSFPEKPKYPRIQSFSFVGNFSILQDIIKDIVDAPLLRCIYIEVTKYNPIVSLGKKATGNVPIKEIIELISGRQQTTMTDFTFIVNQGLNAFPDKILQTLSNLQNLTHLDISGTSIPNLDKALCEVTSIWPKLTTLRFPLTVTDAKASPGLTLSTLHRIAKSCPDLRLFQGLIIVPGTAPSWSISHPANAPVMKHGLTSLLLGSVGNSQLNQMTSTTLSLVHYVARYLYAMFPNIEECLTLSNLHPSFWTQVHECLKLCRDAREIDRSRENPISN